MVNCHQTDGKQSCRVMYSSRRKLYLKSVDSNWFDFTLNTQQRIVLVLYCQNRIISMLVVSITKSSHLEWHCTGSVGMVRSCNFHLSREMSESLMRSPVMCFLSSVALAYCFCRIRCGKNETLHYERTLCGNGVELGTNSFYHFQMTSRKKCCA